MALRNFLAGLGDEITDPEEESFLLFSQSIPSQNLGFVDPKATTLELSISGRELTIHQSPTILSSNRGGGTTGAVVWKITPLFATWLSSPSNILSKQGLLNSSSQILELGCGISGIIGLALAPLVHSYILTDQSYVLKLLNQNLAENNKPSCATASRGRKSRSKDKTAVVSPASQALKTGGNVTATTLDWELDDVSSLTTGLTKSFDAVIACDCIYNDALIAPLVQTCADVCRLRDGIGEGSEEEPTLCIIAQQLRSSEVFESWLVAFHAVFRVWRIPEEMISNELGSDSGFVVHFGILR